ncbi:dienelactone hydrolase family protein [Affinibrenneria salicis]|uniref:Dienelactone hydrolase family protein n=1 Tax=Affinibrenneria salicis TaxID=2590031 RepID=A0A5J5FUQ8_9GAMM|nr:dienelactone hydrolase family protein [Affinibrenneria salicis]KAA8997282.1 dienelactone hydrolase family protein [Affinibrenneria salicis]
MKSDELCLQKPASTGFAAATLPAADTTIATDAVGLIEGATTIPAQGDDLPAWMVRPAGAAEPLPIIIVVQEIFGVHQHIQDVCRRLAKRGYLAIAPELYFRQGDPREYAEISTLVSELVSKVPDAQVLSDLDHTANWAIRQGGDPARLGMTGFCWGGRICWLYAAHNPQLKAGVAWYGRLTGEKTLATPRHPVDVAIALSAPVLGLYGAQDHSIPPDHIETMRKALRAANAEAEIIVYPEAGHAFNADYRPSYHQPSAQDGWQRMLDWFARCGLAAE